MLILFSFSFQSVNEEVKKIRDENSEKQEPTPKAENGVINIISFYLSSGLFTLLLTYNHFYHRCTQIFSLWF